MLILFIKTEKTTCKIFRNLFRCEDFRWLDYYCYYHYHDCSDGFISIHRPPYAQIWNFSKLTHTTKSKMNNPWPCRICHKRVAKNHNAVCCNVCNQWVHISCNNINRYTYSKLQKELQAPWYCKKCIKNTIPYSKLSNTQLEELMTGKLLTSPKLTIEKKKQNHFSLWWLWKCYKKWTLHSRKFL